MECRAQRISLESDPFNTCQFWYMCVTSTCSCHRKHEYYRLAVTVYIKPEQLFYYYGSSDNDDIELILLNACYLNIYLLINECLSKNNSTRTKHGIEMKSK